MGRPRHWQRPTPSVTQIVCPFGCVCQAVRAPGVKWTLLALKREPSDGAATVSTNTAAPVNHSLGPAAVSTPFLVIFMLVLLTVSISDRRLRVQPGSCPSKPDPVRTVQLAQPTRETPN